MGQAFVMSHTIRLQVWEKNVILTKSYLLAPKYGGEIWHQYGDWRGSWCTPGRTGLTKMCMHHPGKGATVLGRKMWWGITVNKEPACPVAPHPYTAYIHSLLYGPGDTLGLHLHDGEIVQLDGMTCCVGVFIDEEETLRCSLNLSPKVLPLLLIYSTVHPGWWHLYLYIAPSLLVIYYPYP